MNRKWNLLLIFLLMSTLVFGQTTKSNPAVKTPQYIMHVVKFGETLTKISKKYGVTINAILNVNPSLTDNNLMPEQIIRIPNTNNKKVLTNSNTGINGLQPKVKNTELTSKNAKYHTVQQGQTMYAISKMYGISIADIQKWNNLKDVNVKIGTQLLVAQIPAHKEEITINNPKPKKPIIEDNEKPDIDSVSTISKIDENTDIQASDNANQQDLSKIFKAKAAASANMQTLKGTGAPMTTSLGAMESVYFAMHKTLPIGTIIKIKNLINNKIVYAKVIGKLPETDENKHVIVRYSLGVKKDLQLQNGKCYVQLEYPD